MVEGWMVEGWMVEGWMIEGWMIESWMVEGWMIEGYASGRARVLTGVVVHEPDPLTRPVLA